MQVSVKSKFIVSGRVLKVDCQVQTILDTKVLSLRTNYYAWVWAVHLKYYLLELTTMHGFGQYIIGIDRNVSISIWAYSGI